jgi:hypothetical protein
MCILPSPGIGTLTTVSVMSFVGYDYVKQLGVPPDEDGVEWND